MVMSSDRKGGLLVGSGIGLVLLGVIIGYCLSMKATQWSHDTVVIDHPGHMYYEKWVDGTMYSEENHVYFFNLTNAYDYLHRGAQPNVSEVGPYVYKQIVKKVDVHFINDETVSYKLWTTQEFLPNQTHGTQNDIIIQLSEAWLRAAYQTPGYSDLALISAKIVPSYLKTIYKELVGQSGINSTSLPLNMTNVPYNHYYHNIFLPASDITDYYRLFQPMELQALYNVLIYNMDTLMPKAGGTFEESVGGLMQQIYAGELRRLLTPFILSQGPYNAPMMNEHHNLEAISSYVTYLAHLSYNQAANENLGLFTRQSVDNLIHGYHHPLFNTTTTGILSHYSTARKAKQDLKNWGRTVFTGKHELGKVRSWIKLYMFDILPQFFYPNTSDSLRAIQGYSEDQVSPVRKIRIKGTDPQDYIIKVYVPEFYRTITMIHDNINTCEGSLTLNRFAPPTDFLNVSRYDNLDYGAVYDGLHNTTLPRNYPLYASWPHYLYADVNFTTVGGLTANKTVHQWYMDIEPISGTVIRRHRAHQTNQQAFLEMTAHIYPNIEIYNSTVVPYYWLAQIASLNTDILKDYQDKIVMYRQTGFLLLVILPTIGGILFFLGILYFYKNQWDHRHEYEGVVDDDVDTVTVTQEVITTPQLSVIRKGEGEMKKKDEEKMKKRTFVKFESAVPMMKPIVKSPIKKISK